MENRSNDSRITFIDGVTNLQLRKIVIITARTRRDYGSREPSYTLSFSFTSTSHEAGRSGTLMYTSSLRLQYFISLLHIHTYQVYHKCLSCITIGSFASIEYRELTLDRYARIVQFINPSELKFFFLHTSRLDPPVPRTITAFLCFSFIKRSLINGVIIGTGWMLLFWSFLRFLVLSFFSLSDRMHGSAHDRY